ncbi:phytanoyl-CoA dioxygenase family protein [Xenophilus arseniciresistens]|uniref:Phytanoyl-CoA dioxygenase family protein n=1 Tax=Xenophilus arseniciresistens TaxID=1283306 RepID=A0AAE3T0S4_9BURK|nr:phytanoyl-CoA dioxygenase family protein [Xenophilus arseniciresistens]MDA7416602.1 phytanoyl-CoA dioxygenase family protein [Xenophilus arseniciresistens]
MKDAPAAAADWLAHYESQGYALLADFVPAGWLAAMREAVDQLQGRVASLQDYERARLVFERDLSARGRGGIAAEEVGDALFIIGEPETFDPIFLRLLSWPPLVQASRQALGRDAVVAHFMNVTFKHPRFGRSIGWHRDFPNTYICTQGSDFMRLMLCLDGMDEETGATAFVPGSHRVTDEAAREAKRQEDVRGSAVPPTEGVRTLACRPGDLVLIHPKVRHGGGMNTGARPRRNVVLQVGCAKAPLVTDNSEGCTGLLLLPLPDRARIQS